MRYKLCVCVLLYKPPPSSLVSARSSRCFYFRNHIMFSRFATRVDSGARSKFGSTMEATGDVQASNTRTTTNGRSYKKTGKENLMGCLRQTIQLFHILTCSFVSQSIVVAGVLEAEWRLVVQDAICIHFSPESEHDHRQSCLTSSCANRV